MAEKGIVYIVGAGPGDAGLITLKGVRCIARADVIVYDHLVNEEILVHAKPGARRIYAGKEGGDHTLVQDEINRILVEEARQGRVVARVKGGDPYSSAAVEKRRWSGAAGNRLRGRRGVLGRWPYRPKRASHDPARIHLHAAS
jgi:siroheme synthase